MIEYYSIEDIKSIFINQTIDVGNRYEGQYLSYEIVEINNDQIKLKVFWSEEILKSLGDNKPTEYYFTNIETLGKYFKRNFIKYKKYD